MTDIGLVILIGLPGSGKTTLSQTLTTYLESKNNCIVIPVCYDSLIPANLENHLQWKEARKSVLYDVQQLVNCLKNKEVNRSREWDPVVEKVLKRAGKENQIKIVIIVDDNMYYRSMRYEYFQLARKYELGFCQLYISCSLEDALKRNESRDTAVPAAVITKMYNNVEPPDEKHYSWEKFSLTIPSSTLTDHEMLENVAVLISEAMQEPVLPRQDLSKLREESQIICSTALLHQSDLALRRLVAEEMIKSQHLGSKKAELSAKAIYLAEVRKKLLNDIKLGIHIIPADIIMAVECKDMNEAYKLQEFLSKLFSTSVNEQDSL